MWRILLHRGRRLCLSFHGSGRNDRCKPLGRRRELARTGEWDFRVVWLLPEYSIGLDALRPARSIRRSAPTRPRTESCAVSIFVGHPCYSESLDAVVRRCSVVRVAGYYERRISQTNSALKNRIAAATTHAMTVVVREFTSSPILVRLLVIWMSGITAKGN